MRCLVIAIIVACAAAASVYGEKTVRVGVYQNKPKVFIDEDGVARGIFVDVIDHIADEEGWTLEYVPGTWEQCLRRLEDGEIDIQVDVAYSPQRARRFDFNNESIINNWAQVYTRAGIEISSVLELEGRRVGVLKGDISYEEFVDQLAQFGVACDFVEMDEFLDIFESLDSKQIDAGLISRFFGLEHEDEFDVEKTSIVCCPNDLFFAAGKGRSGALLPAIDRHLSRMKDDPSSLYYRSKERWLTPTSGLIARVPQAVRWFLAITVLAAAAGIVVTLFLKLRVNAMTADLRHEIEEKKRAERDLRDYQRTLEDLVDERTRDLKESERKYRLIADNASDVIWTTDRHGNFDYISPSVKWIRGFEPSELLGKPLEVSIDPESAKLARGLIEDVLQKEAHGRVDTSTHRLEIRQPRKDGAPLWSEVVASPFFGPDGEIGGFQGVTRDITERKEAELALKEREERYRSIFEHATSGILQTTADGRIISANPAAAAMFGFDSPEDLIRTVVSLGDQVYESPAVREAIVKELLETGRVKAEITLRRKDGAEIIADVSFWTVLDEEGRLRFIEGLIDDVSDIKKALGDLEEAYESLRSTQSQLVQSEKMASLGRLVAGIAHELNNPVGAVHSASDTLRLAIARLTRILDNESMDPSEAVTSVKRLINVISNCQGIVDDGSRRVGTIVKRLRAFAHLDEAELQRVDLHSNLEDTIAMYRSRLNPGVTIERDYGDVPPVTCYPANINQMVLQLLSNANQACKKGGMITVATRSDGNLVSVSVKDTGVGIASEDLGRIFDPGFTAWDVRVGAGLGLSICYQIIKDHRGEISVESVKGTGSVFVVKLPIEKQKAE